MRSPYVELSIGAAKRPQPFKCENFSRRKPMSQPEQYDVLILGSGAGGKLLAWHMAGSGRRSAEVAHLARHGAEFGTIAGPVKVDMAKVRQRKREMVEGLVAAHLQNYKASGAELIMGSGRFVAPKTLEGSL